jgi:surface polysaccharide O-acyltransferase-like enzyme
MAVKREYSFDILRVIAMIMVIVIHVSNVYSRFFGFIGNSSYLISLIFNTISRISVPIFFMISGALLVDRKFNKTKYFNRLLKYVIIIAVWDIIYLIWEYFYLGITYNNLYKLLFEPFRAHLWFLYTIIILYLVQPLIKIILDKTNNIFKIILFIVWFIFCFLSMFNASIASLFTLFSYIGFFIIGKYLYEFVKENDLRKYNFYIILLIIMCFMASIYLNFKASIKFDMFYNLFFAYRTPFIIIASILFFILIFNMFSNKEKINKIISTLSDLSLGVYLIHGIFLDITCQIFNYSLINPIIGIPIFTIIICLCSSLCVYLLRKIKLFKYIL